MDTFRSYLTQTDQSLSSFAKRIGKSPNYVSEIASRKRMPSLRVAYDIWVASGHVVPMHFWVEHHASSGSKGLELSHIATPLANEIDGGPHGG